MSSGRTPIGEILLRHEHLRRRELERLLAEDRKQRLVSTLILRAEIDVDDATLALSEQCGYPGALERHLEQRDVQLAKEFPPALMKNMGVVPLTRTAAGALVVIARDPSPALGDVLVSELNTPVELAVVPAIFIERLVQRLTNSPAAASPPELPAIDRPAPTRHRKTISVLMRAALDPATSPRPREVGPHDTSTGMPAIGRPPAPPRTIQIPAREDSGARLQPREGSGATPRPSRTISDNAIPRATDAEPSRPQSPRTISSNTIRRQTGGSAPLQRPDEPQPPRTISSNTIRRQTGGSAPLQRPDEPQPPRTISSNTIRRQTSESAPIQARTISSNTIRRQTGESAPIDPGFETRTPPIGSRGGDSGPVLRPSAGFETKTPPIGSRTELRRPAPPTPPPAGLTLELDADEPPQPIAKEPSRPNTIRRHGATHPIPNNQLQPLLDESEPTTAAIDDIATISSTNPTDVTVSSRPTRPAVVVPTEAIEALADDVPSSERPTKQDVQPPPRGRANVIKRPPTPLPVPPRPALVPIASEPEQLRDPATAQVRPTYPKLELTTSSTDDDWTDFEDAIVTAPPDPDQPPRAETQQSLRTTTPGLPPPIPKQDVVRDIEKALSRATADRLLMKHAATRWSSLLLVTIANDRAKGARGHGPRLAGGVGAIDVPIAASGLIQAACDPAAERPAGKDPVLDLLGSPRTPSSAPVVVDDQVVAVLAAGDGEGDADELRALAGALAVAYQRFPAK